MSSLVYYIGTVLKKLYIPTILSVFTAVYTRISYNMQWCDGGKCFKPNKRPNTMVDVPPSKKKKNREKQSVYKT